MKPYAIRQLSKHFKCILIAMLQYWYIYVKAFYLTPFEELKNYLFWSLLQFFKGVFVLINCDINLQLIKNTLTIFPGQGCPLCLVDYPKKNIRNLQITKYKQNWFIYIYFFFLPCLSLLIYVSKFCRTQLITQKFFIFKSKTVDYIRHEGLDQHFLVDIFNDRTHLQLR